MEQLVARQAHNLEVVRSSRASATNKDECIKMKVLMHFFCSYDWDSAEFKELVAKIFGL